jgi:hypothetical protein
MNRRKRFILFATLLLFIGSARTASAQSTAAPTRLAILAADPALGGDEQAMQWHQDFKSAVIAGLPYAGWRMTEQEIRETLYAFENE